MFWLLTTALVTALGVSAFLSFSRYSKSDAWNASVTPLASIIGSGFLVCGPLLAREFGAAAAAAMAFLLLLAYCVGEVVRFNITHTEPYLAKAGKHDTIMWVSRIDQAVLAIAYAVSVAYYLKLLAEFMLKNVTSDGHAIVARIAVTAIIGILVGLALSGGIRRVEQVAHATVSVKIGIIAGMLTALAGYWWMRRGEPIEHPATGFSWHSAAILLGLLITVQGFETSRFLGNTYSAELRVASMKRAQLISTFIYVAFLVLLTPFLARATKLEGVAGILDIMDFIAPLMGVMVLIGAAASQMSAAVADSIGSAGLLEEAFRGKLSIKGAFILTGILAVSVVWLTDPFLVIAVSSRAFALFYAFQCLTAFLIARRVGVGKWWVKLGFVVVGLVCLLATLVGAPAE